MPAVNGDGERLRQLEALQLQVVHDEAGRYCGKRGNPRFNDYCGGHMIVMDALTRNNDFKFISFNIIFLHRGTHL